MRRDRALLVAGLVVIGGGLLAPLVVPGATADLPDDPREPGVVRIDELPVETTEVRGGTADLRLRVRLEHARNPTPNVTVRFRAYDAESGLLVAERTQRVGTVTGPQTVNGTLTVAREGGYTLETTVFGDGERLDRASREVSGMAALQPPYAQSEAAFAERGVQPVSVSVASADEETTRLRVTTAVRNGGDEPTDGLRVGVTLRGADSNLVADEASLAVDPIRPGRTAGASTVVTVPAGYNYYVDAVLYRDGVVIDTARSVANLDPRETISTDETTREIEFDVSDFERNDQPTAAEAATTETSQPGFGVGVAVAALLVVAALTRRSR